MADAECDVLIVGGGTGGCAAAMAACSLGMRVIMTEPTKMLGGQLTAQMVPPDEHPWIEEFGCTARYRDYRNEVRDLYQPSELMTQDRRLNPGGGWVSRLCHTPWYGAKALDRQFSNPRGASLLDVRFQSEPIGVEVSGDCVSRVRFRRRNASFEIKASIVLDATELGDLLPMAHAEYRRGSESQAEFGEPHGTAEFELDNVQGFTWCLALAISDHSNLPNPRPTDYDRWRSFTPKNWPGPLLNFTFPDPISGKPRTLPLLSGDPRNRSTLFAYRQLVDPTIPTTCRVRQSVTALNWPQNDYFLGSVLDVPTVVRQHRLAEAKALSRCLLYWLRTEAPRHDGGTGYPELTMNASVSGSRDGFAMAPYHRESRRMVTRFTVTEQMVAAECNPGLDRAPDMPKSVGVGHYRIDLHPSANGHGYIDIPSLPFQIPLGALIPVRLRNLLPACKNAGVTHITNGCYRLHPVEWNIGEAAGLLAAFCVTRKTEPAAVYESEELWLDFQRLVHAQGIETAWPNVDLTLPA